MLFTECSDLSLSYGIETHVKMKEDINTMCNLSDIIEERGIEKGIEKGIEQGEGLLAKLMSILFKEGLMSEAQKAAEDETVRQELYKKYKLI